MDKFLLYENRVRNLVKALDLVRQMKNEKYFTLRGEAKVSELTENIYFANMFLHIRNS